VTTLDQAIAQMMAAGMPPLPPGHPRVNTDRIVRYGPKQRAFYRLFEHIGRNGQVYISGAYGIWGTLDPQKIETDWQGLSDVERQQMRERQAAAEARERQKREFRSAAAAKRAAYQWRVAEVPREHAYLAAKGVTAEGVRVDREGTLLVPMYSLASVRPKMVGLQKIRPDGQKRYSAGMAKEGACTTLGKPEDGEPIFVAEGYATARSIRMAIGERHAVVVAFDAGSLLAVVKALRSRYRRSRIVLCADDDWQTDGNPGITKADQARAAVADATLVRPVFAAERALKATDFNDLHAAEGLTRVAELVLAGLAVAASESVSTPSTACAEEWDEFRRKRLFWSRSGLEASRENVALILQHHPAWRGVLAMDEFANAVVKRRAPPFGRVGEWTEEDDLALGMWLRAERDIEISMKSVDQLSAGVLMAANAAKFHPVREYLDALAWDGTPRLDEWLADFLSVPRSTYASLVGRFFFIGMVARVYRPGCMMRSVLILEGEQNKGKSTALRIIGGPWFSDTPFIVGDKDSYQSLRGKLLYEISELDAFSRAEATRVKAFISSTTDTYRASYDRRAKDWPRQCVFGATTNQHEYLKDPSGATRFHPVGTGEINLDGLADVRDQLFAEAAYRYRAGERWHASPQEEREHFHAEQQMREIEDPWHRSIADHLKRMEEYTDPKQRDRVHVGTLLTEALKVEMSKIDNARGMAMRVSTIMRSLGWHKRRESDGDRGYFYERPQRTPAPAVHGETDGVPF
jgi:putative DNA primase/helicase